MERDLSAQINPLAILAFPATLVLIAIILLSAVMSLKNIRYQLISNSDFYSLGIIGIIIGLSGLVGIFTGSARIRQNI